jgi:hypothetical protein
MAFDPFSYNPVATDAKTVMNQTGSTPAPVATTQTQAQFMASVPKSTPTVSTPTQTAAPAVVSKPAAQTSSWSSSGSGSSQSSYTPQVQQSQAPTPQPYQDATLKAAIAALNVQQPNYVDATKPAPYVSQLDLKAELDKLTQSRIAELTRALEAKRAESTTNINAIAAKVPDQYNASRLMTQNQAAVAALNLDRFLAARGISGMGMSGAQTQAKVSQQNAVTGAMSDITKNENNALNDLTAQKLALEKSYMNDLSAGLAGISEQALVAEIDALKQQETQRYAQYQDQMNNYYKDQGLNFQAKSQAQQQLQLQAQLDEMLYGRTADANQLAQQAYQAQQQNNYQNAALAQSGSQFNQTLAAQKDQNKIENDRAKQLDEYNRLLQLGYVNPYAGMQYDTKATSPYSADYAKKIAELRQTDPSSPLIPQLEAARAAKIFASPDLLTQYGGIYKTDASKANAAAVEGQAISNKISALNLAILPQQQRDQLRLAQIQIANGDLENAKLTIANTYLPKQIEMELLQGQTNVDVQRGQLALGWANFNQSAQEAANSRALGWAKLAQDGKSQDEITLDKLKLEAAKQDLQAKVNYAPLTQENIMDSVLEQFGTPDAKGNISIDPQGEMLAQIYMSDLASSGVADPKILQAVNARLGNFAVPRPATALPKDTFSPFGSF